MGNFFKNSKKGKDLHGVNEKNYDNIVIKKLFLQNSEGGIYHGKLYFL